MKNCHTGMVYLSSSSSLSDVKSNFRKPLPLCCSSSEFLQKKIKDWFDASQLYFLFRKLFFIFLDAVANILNPISKFRGMVHLSSSSSLSDENSSIISSSDSLKKKKNKDLLNVPFSCKKKKTSVPLTVQLCSTIHRTSIRQDCLLFYTTSIHLMFN